MRALLVLAVLALVCGCLSTPEKPTANSLTSSTLATDASPMSKKGRRIQADNVPEDTATTQPDPCQLKRQSIRQAIRKLNTCATDSDCAVAQLFRCWSLINANADTAQIRKDVEDYNQSCQQGQSFCDSPPTAAEIKCEDGMCVEARAPEPTTQTEPRRRRNQNPLGNETYETTLPSTSETTVPVITESSTAQTTAPTADVGSTNPAASATTSSTQPVSMNVPL